MNRSFLWALAALLAVALVSLYLGLWLRALSAPEWMALDTTQAPPAMRPWAVEADCYSQLARVQRILKGQGLIQNHFTVENWPEGLVPSTTAPFDYVILLLYAPLALFTNHPLDWAGALVSPALWVALVLFWMLFRSREFTLIGRSLFLLGSALLPAFIWATAFGRPRHQSLIIALLAIGLTAEYERWHVELTPKRAWNIFAGLVWGLACWTSLFEPTAVVVVLVLFNLIARRRESPAFLISFGVVMLIALLLEGAHIFVPPPEYQPALVNWLGTIAEMRGFDVEHIGAFFEQMSLIVVFLPFVAWRLCARAEVSKTDYLLILLTSLLVLCTLLESRWVYYSTLGELFLVVRYCQVQTLRLGRLMILFFFFAGVVEANVTQIQARVQAAPNQPSQLLAEISRSIDQPGGIMAPWWLSPGLLYFSGQPIVSGSSHCGISGIVASAKFYSTTNWIEAEQILKDRKVRWIVVFNDDDPRYVYPVLNVERGILGLPDYTDDSKAEADLTVWQILVTGRFLPSSMRLRAVTEQFKLYEYEPGRK